MIISDSTVLLAKRLGATEYVNPLTIPKNKTVSQYLLETFDGGFDYTFECIGKEETAVSAQVLLAKTNSGMTPLAAPWGTEHLDGRAGVGSSR